MTATINRACRGFTDGYTLHCEGDEPEAALGNGKYCMTCRKAAGRVRTAAEDEWELVNTEYGPKREARVEFERVMGLCSEVLEQ